MDGKSHKKFAPIFGFGVSLLLYKNGLLNTPIGPAIIPVSTLSSIMTSRILDADLYADYPKIAILDSKPRKKKPDGFYWFRINGEVKKYRPPREKYMRYAALFFKSIGVRKHRDWRTHAPTVYFPLSILSYLLLFGIKLPAPINYIIAPIQAIIFGWVLGILSHIVADAPNKGGVPLGPSNRQYSFTRAAFGPYFSNFFKSSNKVFSTLFMVLAIDLVLFVINYDIALAVNKAIFEAIKTVFVLTFGSLFKLLFNFLKGLFGF